MAGPAILKIDVIADATKAIKALDQTGAAGKKAGDGFGKLKGTIGAALGTAAVVGFGKASVSAALESEKATARLDAVFSAMGDTTGKASEEAQKYAAALSKKTAIDDESIIAAQAQLASFSAVSDETARGAGIFDRATAAAADLAAAGFGTLDTNSVQLGKALQDPVKGLTALSKSGVTFTDQQKAQIAAMQESGDLLGAQKVVLAAVEGQVKGTAEATATSSDKMTLAFGETQEAIGAALLPALEALAPILQEVAGFIQANTSWLLPLAGAIGLVVVAVKAWSLATELWSGITTIATAVQKAFSAAMIPLPILLAIAAIAALVGIVVLAYQKVDWFRAIVDKAWQLIQVAWDGVLAAFQKVWNWIRQNWPLLLAILTGPIGAAVLLIVRNWETIKSTVLGVFDAIKDAVSGAWRFVLDKMNAMKTGITSTFSGIADTIKAPINAVIRTINGFRVPELTIGGQDPLGSFGPSIPRTTIGGWKLPHIPELATGGSVLRTGMALVHAGETFSGVGRSLAGGTTIVVNVTAAGLGADSPEIQRAVVKALRGHVARNGPLDVPVRSRR